MRSAFGFRPTLSPGSWQSPGSVRKSKKAGCRATWQNRRMADDMEITLHSQGLQVRFPRPGQPAGKRRGNASGGKGPYFLSNRGPVASQPRPTSMPVNACLQGCQAPFPPEMYIPVNQSSANFSPTLSALYSRSSSAAWNPRNPRDVPHAEGGKISVQNT